MMKKNSEPKSWDSNSSNDQNQSRSNQISDSSETNKNAKDNGKIGTRILKQSQRIKTKSRKLCEIEMASKQNHSENSNKAKTRGGKKAANKAKQKEESRSKPIARTKAEKLESKSKTINNKIQSNSSKDSDELSSSDWEIPEKLSDMFSIFWKFIDDTNHESEDEADRFNTNQQKTLHKHSRFIEDNYGYTSMLQAYENELRTRKY